MGSVLKSKVAKKRERPDGSSSNEYDAGSIHSPNCCASATSTWERREALMTTVRSSILYAESEAAADEDEMKVHVAQRYEYATCFEKQGAHRGKS